MTSIASKLTLPKLHFARWLYNFLIIIVIITCITVNTEHQACDSDGEDLPPTEELEVIKLNIICNESSFYFLLRKLWRDIYKFFEFEFKLLSASSSSSCWVRVPVVKYELWVRVIEYEFELLSTSLSSWVRVRVVKYEFELLSTSSSCWVGVRVESAVSKRKYRGSKICLQNGGNGDQQR